MRRWILFSSVMTLAVSLRFFSLESIPGEWYGDISNVHEYVSEILRGEWPFYFLQSPGPVYHYLIAPVVWLMPYAGYETYKRASVLVSLGGLAATYLLIRELADRRIALLTVLMMSVGFWYVAWSRLGNSQIVIPALMAVCGYYFVRAIRQDRAAYLLISGMIASVGWYTYPQTFVFPGIIWMYSVGYAILTKRLSAWRKRLTQLTFLLIAGVMPFIWMVRHDEGNFSGSGYVGSKIIPVFSANPANTAFALGRNFFRVILMLHRTGDIVFVQNVSGSPHLDVISRWLFLIGLVYLWRTRGQWWLLSFAALICVLILPSLSPALPAVEIPNSGRTIAVVPLVFFVLACGVKQLFFLVKQGNGSLIGSAVVTAAIGVAITGLNLHAYFVRYPAQLPDQNRAWGTMMARFVDSLDQRVAVYFASCCWGSWGHPEPKAVAYNLCRPRAFIAYEALLSDCSQITRFPAVIFFSPGDEEGIAAYRQCFPDAKPEDGFDGSRHIYRMLRVEAGFTDGR